MANLTNAETTSKLGFQVLSDGDCEKIVDTAMKILENIGWVFSEDENGEARGALEKTGCRIEGDTVFFPRELVKKVIAAAPKDFVIYDQLGNEKIHVSAENSHTYLGDAVMAPFLMDLETGERMPGCSEYAHEAALVCDALPNIDWVAGMVWHKDGKHERLTGVYDAKDMIEATNKPVWLWMADEFSDRYVRDICAAVAGSWENFVAKPFTFFATSNKEASRSIAVFKSGAPAWVGGEVFPGGTGPVQIVGSIAQALAECLANIVFQQTFSPGTPFICDIAVNIMNFKTAGYTSTAPEWSLAGAAVSNVFHYLGLPCMAHMGLTDSPTLDAQAAADIMAHLMMAKLSGIGIAYFSGFLEAANTSSLEAIVLGNEIAGYVNRIVNGLEVNDETLAYDVIERIGPSGMFMNEISTFEGYQDYWLPTVFTRESWAEYEQTGSMDFRSRANKFCKDIVAQGIRNPKPPEVLAKIDEIIAQADADFEASVAK